MPYNDTPEQTALTRFLPLGATLGLVQTEFIGTLPSAHTGEVRLPIGAVQVDYINLREVDALGWIR